MQQYSNSLFRQFPNSVSGNAAIGVSVSVYERGTTNLVTLYADDDIGGATLPNPLTTNDIGFYSFYAPDGKYTLHFGSSQFPDLNIQLIDALNLVDAFNTAIDATGYILVDNAFSGGYTVTQRNEALLFDGVYYVWKGALNKTVPAASSPAATGGIGDGAWQAVLDNALRQELLDGTAVIAGQTGQRIVDIVLNLPTKSFFDFVSKSKWNAYSLRLATLDYTAELQSAADYSALNKVAIYFPAGWAPHTGFSIKSNTVFIGGGQNHVVLENTTTTNKSVTVSYVPESLDWQNYWALIGMRITARTKGSSESQVGIDLDTAREGYLSRLKIDNHYVNFRERATWSCYFEHLNIEDGYYNFLVDVGPSTPGVPNTYVGINNRFGDYNIDVRLRGLGATVFLGGCSESARVAGLRISGNENRTIGFVNYNFENNELDFICGDNAVSNSGPTNVAFDNCQFNSRIAEKPYSMQLNRGTGLALTNCNFIGYTQVAELSSNFGDFTLIGNGGISTFAQSTNANSPIPLAGLIYGRKARYARMDNQGFEFCQDADTYKLLRSRRQTEQYERFSIGSNGRLFYHAFNTATPDTELGRVAANVMGVGTDDGFRTGLFPTASYPSSPAFGQGTCIFDSDKNRPMYSRGSEWRDALGTIYANQTVSGLTVSNGTVVPFNIVASNIELGAMVKVSFSDTLNGVTMFAEVSAVSQITVYFTNMTGSTKTINGTLYLAINRNN